MEKGVVQERFQKVHENDPVTMCSPLVVQTKAKIFTDTQRRMHGTTYDQTQPRSPSSKQIHGANPNNPDLY